MLQARRNARDGDAWLMRSSPALRRCARRAEVCRWTVGLSISQSRSSHRLLTCRMGAVRMLARVRPVFARWRHSAHNQKAADEGKVCSGELQKHSFMKMRVMGMMEGVWT